MRACHSLALALYCSPMFGRSCIDLSYFCSNFKMWKYLKGGKPPQGKRKQTPEEHAEYYKEYEVKQKHLFHSEWKLNRPCLQLEGSAKIKWLFIMILYNGSLKAIKPLKNHHICFHVLPLGHPLMCICFLL